MGKDNVNLWAALFFFWWKKTWDMIFEKSSLFLFRHFGKGYLKLPTNDLFDTQLSPLMCD